MSEEAEKQALAEVVGRWAVETQDFALIFISPSARVLAANPALTRVLGYAPEDLVGETLQRIFTPEDLERGLADHELRVARAVGRAEDDRWHVAKNGSRVFCSGVLMALRDEHAQITGFLKAIRDRTDLRTQTEALENRLAEALRLAGRKDAFLSTLAHELRSPINAIGNATLVIRRSDQEDQRAKATEIIERQTATIARLVEDLLDATRIDVGRLTIKVGPVVLQDAIAGAVGLHAETARARQQQLQVLLPEVPVVLEADAMRLQQIFGNLLENAIKYTPAHGNIWVTATVEGKFAVIRVQDDGSGMSPQTLPRIFEMFTRDDRALDSASEGLGIGLAVVKNLVQLHHGIVEVQSAGPGRGSEFTVNLPLQQPTFE